MANEKRQCSSGKSLTNGYTILGYAEPLSEGAGEATPQG